MATRTWHCGEGHTFTYGDEEWHYEDYANQYLLLDGAPVPRYCQSPSDNDPDETCMDSSSLIYD